MHVRILPSSLHVFACNSYNQTYFSIISILIAVATVELVCQYGRLLTNQKCYDLPDYFILNPLTNNSVVMQVSTSTYSTVAACY